MDSFSFFKQMLVAMIRIFAAALFGILVVSWTVDLPWAMEPSKGWTDATDQISYWIVNFFLLEKSRPIFAFLFGLGFYIQMERAEARGSRFVPVYVRRLLILFLFGAAHYILAEHDILYRYAVCGLFLLPLRKLNPKLLLVLAVICVLIPFTRSTLIAHDRYLETVNLTNARTEITLDAAELEAYVGEYEIGGNRSMFIVRDGDALFGQWSGHPRSPGSGQPAGRPFRLFAESPTAFFLRSADARLSFVKDSAGTVTGIVLHGTSDVPGRKLLTPEQSAEAKSQRDATQFQSHPTHRIYATGTFGQIVSMRAGLFWKDISSWTFWLGELGDPFPYFLLGLYAGRRRIFTEIATHRQFIRKVMWWSLALGLAGTTFITMVKPGWPLDNEFLPITIRTLARLVERFSSPAMGLAYIAGLTLLLQWDAWKSRLGPFGAVGRMALTNYLMQSVAFVLLFFGYGLGWYGQVGAFYALLLATALFALQIVASQWWLRRFRFGPAEWLWRTLTYGKLQPMSIEKSREAV